MIFIHHRINTISQLLQKQLQQGEGAEIDVRYHQNELVLHHDPFAHHETQPERLRDFLQAWPNTGPLILNLKTEGVEQTCIDLMQQYQVSDWFFLDMSMPYMVKYSLRAANASSDAFSIDNLAVRFSEFEPLEYCLSFAGRARWVWVDCFTHLPMDPTIYRRLKQAGFRICLVSPELQGHSLLRIKEFKKQVVGMDLDAVCSKRKDLWFGS